MEGVPDGERDDAQPAPGAVDESAVIHCMPGVRAIILRMTRDVNVTNDLTQEVIMASLIAVREGRVKQPDALLGYMRETARHMVYAANRKMKPVTVEHVSEVETVWGEAPRTPLEFAEDDELRRLAHEVLDELPAERDRELLTGFYIDGLDKAQLMALLDLGADQFDKVMFRARSRMRDRLHEKMHGRAGRVGGSAPAGVHSPSKPRIG